RGIGQPVYLCDTFAGVVKAGPLDNAYRGGEHADTSVEEVEGLLDSLGLKAKILVGIFPTDTAHLVSDLTFRFCHVDVDTYESAEDVIKWIWGRLVPGAMVVYDDYGYENCAGVTQHVEQQRGFEDRLVLHNLNGHAVVIKTK